MANDAKDVLYGKENKLTFRFAFTLDTSNSMAGTDQSAVPIPPLPLFINAIENAILLTTI